MKNIIKFLLILSLAVGNHSLLAQVKIHVEVMIAIVGFPAPYVEVQILAENAGIDTSITTGFDGQFEIDLNLNIGDEIIFKTNDFCSGEELASARIVMEDNIYVSFTFCALDQFPCVAFFEWIPISRLDIQFTELSGLDALSYHWDFGDGATSNEHAPVHSYPSPGTYRTTLSIMTTDSCEATSTLDVWVDTFICECPEIAFPVCVLNEDGERITYDNPCFAYCAGYYEFVACQDTCGCPAISSPICIDAGGGHWLTYTNSCELSCAGYDLVDTCRIECECPDDYEPVCAVQDDGVVITFNNHCEAFCAGYFDVIPCFDDSLCKCDDIYQPVWAVDFSGNIQQFDNECLANCQGYYFTIPYDSSCVCDGEFDPVCVEIPKLGISVTLPSPCFADCFNLGPTRPCGDCVCPEIYDPVCVVTDSGDTLTFNNDCLAICAGYFNIIACDGSCGCWGVYDPVCVKLDNGTVKEYQSACLAFCDGFDLVYNCQTVCACPDTLDPVCVILPDGNYKEYINSCVAKCYGYSEQVNCNGVVGDEDANKKRLINIGGFNIYPNPGKNILNVEINNLSSREVSQLILQNIQGKILSQHKIPKGSTNFTLPISHLNSGIYWIIIVGDEYKEVKKYIKS